MAAHRQHPQAVAGEAHVHDVRAVARERGGGRVLDQHGVAEELDLAEVVAAHQQALVRGPAVSPEA